jgi:hypothetical protein
MILPGEADPWREAQMGEASAAVQARNGTPVRTPAKAPEAVKETLARTLEEKLKQGFTVESETETQAVLVMKGRRRWFGLTNSPSVRYEVSVDQAGRATSRRL